MSSYKQIAKRFREETSGNIAVSFGLMSTVMMFSIGAAVDYGRAVHAESKLQSAVDAAATAAAAAVGYTAAQKTEIANNFLDNNNDGSFGSTPQVDVQISGPNVKVTATGTVPTSFTRIMGIQTMPITAMAEAGATGRNIEVAMMIDVTGSMGAVRSGKTKIQGLKEASVDLLNILYPGGPGSTSGQVRVAIAPMADYVNAGPYAVDATGLPSSGAYAKLTNLTSTKNGPFSGNHSGYYGSSTAAQPLGSQQGATNLSGPVVPGQVSTAAPGQTYASAHCTAPGGSSGPVPQLPRPGSAGGYPLGYYLHDGVSDGSLATPPAQLNKGPDLSGGQNYYYFNRYDNSGDSQGWRYGSGWSGWAGDSDLAVGGYYIPVPQDPSLVTYMTDGGATIGVPVTIDNPSNPIPVQIKNASDYPGGYKQITGFSSGNFTYASTLVTTGYFLPVPVSMTGGGGTDPSCTGTNEAPDVAGAPLVTCVTDRTGTQRYTDASPFGAPVGPYNQVAPGRSTNKLNYSEDGKCYTAGRELPAIIPLTNDRTPIDQFFAIPDNKLIGGATPGHLGHAWAWYMLSPNWNGVWPAGSDAAAYEDETVKKFAVIMTDGEYNTQYSNVSSATQAIELCNGMKSKGIHVITIGFGFESSDPTRTPAVDTLMNCASDTSSYFFPYDAAALKEAFREIGAKITGGASRLVVMK